MLGKPCIKLYNLNPSLSFPCLGLNPIIDAINHDITNTVKMDIKSNFIHPSTYKTVGRDDSSIYPRFLKCCVINKQWIKKSLLLSWGGVLQHKLMINQSHYNIYKQFHVRNTDLIKFTSSPLLLVYGFSSMFVFHQFKKSDNFL